MLWQVGVVKSNNNATMKGTFVARKHAARPMSVRVGVREPCAPPEARANVERRLPHACRQAVANRPASARGATLSGRHRKTRPDSAAP